MIIASYKVLITNLQQKYYFLSHLYETLLIKDPSWHFFLDEEGITLRVGRLFQYAVEKYLKHGKIKFKGPDEFDPKLHEYFGIRFVGDDLQPIFHDLSVLSVKYPTNVMLEQILERVNHILINQRGMHSFKREAKIYADLAIGRAILAGLGGRDKDPDS